MDVVRAASELDVLNGGGTALGERPHVMELQKPAFIASTHRPSEDALATVSLPHQPPDSRGNVPRSFGGRTSGPWLADNAEPVALDVGDQEGERFVDDGCNVAVRILMAQQRLGSLLKLAAAISSAWLLAVKCGASNDAVVRFNAPASSASRICGTLREARATSMRL